MSGHEHSLGHRVRPRWLICVGALLAAFLTFFSLTPAGAASTTKAQLTFTGVASADNPIGGSIIGIHPGDSISFTTSSAPTAGLDKLGLGDLVGGLLNGVLGFQSAADFSHLPGGSAHTILKGNAAKSLTFAHKGTYPFTYAIQGLQLLGGAQTISLDGNQLNQAGVKLNAANEYIGSIVVADNPPPGGIGIQLPTVKLAPNLPLLGQLPTITIPGIRPPTIPLAVPNLNPGKPGSGSAKSPAKAPPVKAPAYTPPGLTVPDMVVPHGGGNAVYAGGNGGFFNGSLPDTTNQIANLTQNLANGSNPVSAVAGGQATPNSTAAKGKAVDVASRNGSPSSQVPIVLAILAIIALALVAGTYARLFLMRKQQ
ncbi:MAG: hypothetical protein ACR2LX_17705 [Jatrophihabitans sp.]